MHSLTYDPADVHRMIRLVKISHKVGQHGCKAEDLIRRLVAVEGEAEGLRLLATFCLMHCKDLDKGSRAEAVEHLESWDDRRCPRCDAVCEQCLDDAEIYS